MFNWKTKVTVWRNARASVFLTVTGRLTGGLPAWNFKLKFTVHSQPEGLRLTSLEVHGSEYTVGVVS